MTLKASALIALALCCAGCGGTPYLPAQTQPPPLWSGESGWRTEFSTLRVNNGQQQTGAVIVEHDVSLARTGIVKQTVNAKEGRGNPIVVPAGSKVFARNFTLMRQGRSLQTFDPIEWCVVLPETVCISWENATRAHYAPTSRQGGFAFLPSPDFFNGVRGPMPEIEEGPVDFGVRFKKQVRLVELSDTKVTLETIYSDGTHAQRSRVDSYKWEIANQMFMQTEDYTVMLTRGADSKTVEVQRLNGPDTPNERTVVLSALVGVDGRVKDARIVVSSGNASMDAKTLEEVKNSWKLTPAVEKGQPIEKWGRFAITFKLVD